MNDRKHLLNKKGDNNLMLNEDQEVWKTYPDYSFIEVNQFGKVRTKDRYVPGKNGRKRLIKGRILKQWLTRGGHVFVHFRVDGKMINLLVSRSVAICFIPTLIIIKK